MSTEPSQNAVVSNKRSEVIDALDYALTRLAELDKRKSRIVEMKFFAGLNFEEIYHAALEISTEKQTAFLEKECGKDIELKKEVEIPLYFEDNPVNLINGSPEDLAIEIINELESTDYT